MRIERDALGTMELPDEAYYGIQSARAQANFDVSPLTFNDYPNVVRALAEVKKACALANKEIGALEPHKADAIVQAADEVIAGKFQGQFPVNVFRGCGTSANMNINEVLANRANEILTGKKGDNEVNANSHVNMGQSSNDVFPTAEAIVLYREISALLDAVPMLEEALENKVNEFADVVKLGRTLMQDAVPMTLGQCFSGYLAAVKRNKNGLKAYRDEFRTVILGATAIGTGMGIMPGYLEAVYPRLSEVVGFDVIKNENFFDGMQNSDPFLILSAHVKALACVIGKMANDFRILSSGPRAGWGEIVLPANQPGSSIMPGKINPFTCDMMVQIMQQVCANDWAITLSVPSGDTDLGPSAVLNFMGILESMEILRRGIESFTVNCARGIKANRDVCLRYAEESTSLATMVSALFGYPVGSKIAKIAYEEGITCKEAALREKLIPAAAAEELFDVMKLTNIQTMQDMFAKYTTLRKLN